MAKDLDILIDGGTFVCIHMRKQPRMFGVLLRDVTKYEPFAPCLMMDLTYEMINYKTFSLRTLEIGMEQMNREPYHKQALVMKHLKDFLRIEREDELAMEKSVAATLRLYKKRAAKLVVPSSHMSAALENVTQTKSLNAPTDGGLGNTKPDKQQTDDDAELQGGDTSDATDPEGIKSQSSVGDGLSDCDSSTHLQAQHEVDEKTQEQSTTKDVEALLLLTRENAKLKQMISGMAKESSTASQSCNSNEIIEITSDDEDALFVPDVVGRPRPMTTSRVRGVKRKASLSKEAEDTYERDTLRAAQGRIKKKRDGSLRNWIESKARNCTPDKIYHDMLEATANNMIEVFELLRKLGYAVIMDFNQLRDPDELSTYSLFQEKHAPTLAQANFYKAGNAGSGSTKPPMDTIFEGVMVNQGNMGIDTVVPQTALPGTELRSVMTYGTRQYKAYQKLCKGQGEDIIRGMFRNHTKRNGTNPAAEPTFWHTEHNIVVGGQNHQHPHCDQGKVGCFASETVFPFVATHGFGINEFQMWLLPMKKKRDYGYLYQFPKTAILFMRGDFMHAGPCMQEARSHSLFFPLAEAGWDDEAPYWESSRIDGWMKNPAIFLNNDFRCPPFAWPHYSKRTPSGDQVITYPADVTKDLVQPQKRTKPKRKRAFKKEGEVKKEKLDLNASFEEEFQAAQKRNVGVMAV